MKAKAPKRGETLWDEMWRRGFKDSIEATGLDRLSRRCYDIIKKWIGERPGPVLEAGSGTGRFCIALAEANTDTRVTALDLSRSSLELARAGAGKRGLDNISYVRGDIRQIPFEAGSFDIVFNEGVIEHFIDYESVIREMRRVAKLGGMVICAVPNRLNLIYNMTLSLSEGEASKYGRTKLFTRRELEDAFLKCGLSDTRVSGFDPAHGVTRLSAYWPKCELLGRKIDRLLVRPLDAVTNKGFSSRFGFEIIIRGIKR